MSDAAPKHGGVSETVREAIFSFGPDDLPNVETKQVIDVLKNNGVEITATVRSTVSRLLKDAKQVKTARAPKTKKSQLLDSAPKKKRSEKASLEPATPLVRNNILDQAMGNLVKTLQADKCASNLIDNQKQAEMVGLPIPSLMLQYVIGINILPLSRIFQIVGQEGSCKSSFLYEIMRWFCRYGGVAIFAENENKDAKDLRDAILKHDAESSRRVAAYPTKSIEDWQTLMTRTVVSNKEVMVGPNGKGGVGKIYPVLIGVDSIKGTNLRGAIEKVLQEGYASIEYPKMAAVISQYMQTIPELIGGFPFLIIGTNHLKPSVNPVNPNIPVDNVPGGKSLKFMETYEIKMEKLGSFETLPAGASEGRGDDLPLGKKPGGVRLRFRVSKSCTGPTKRFGDACFYWDYQSIPLIDNDGNPVHDEDGLPILQTQQHAWWDWWGADIDFLLSWQSELRKDAKAEERRALREVIDLQEHTSSKGKRISSQVLGIPADAPVTFQKAGAMLHARPDLLRKLRNELGILERTAFQPGLDYAEQVEAASRKSRIEFESLPVQAASEVFENDEE